jgi:hypothetical protein
MIPTLIALSILLGSLRALGVRSQSFQAAAHLFVGGLIGGYLATRQGYLLGLTIALSILEIICFLAFRKKNAERDPLKPVP